MKQDKGHIELMEDLTDLLEEAKDFHFHDFKNTDYATPKIVLVDRLQGMIEGVKTGKYDN